MWNLIESVGIYNQKNHDENHGRNFNNNYYHWWYDNCNIVCKNVGAEWKLISDCFSVGCKCAYHFWFAVYRLGIFLNNFFGVIKGKFIHDNIFIQCMANSVGLV